MIHIEIRKSKQILILYYYHHLQAQISNKTAPQTIATASGSSNEINALMTSIIQSPTHSLQNQSGKFVNFRFKKKKL